MSPVRILLVIFVLLAIINSCEAGWKDKVANTITNTVRNIIDKGNKDTGKSWQDKVRDSRTNPGQNNQGRDKTPGK